MIAEDIFSTYFDRVIWLLKAAGLWGDDAQTAVSPFRKMYNAFWQIYVFVLYLPSETLYIVYSFNDLNKFLGALRDNGNHISAMYKAFNFLMRRKKMIRLMKVLSQGNYCYENYGEFDPKRIIDEEKKGAVVWVNTLLYLAMSNCVGMMFTMLYIFIFMEESQFKLENEERIYGQELPVQSILPFHTHSKIRYLIALFYTLIPITSVALMIITLDGIFITFMSCVSAHLKVLQGAFKTIHPRCLRRLGIDLTLEFLHEPQNLQREIHKEMVICVKHLQMVFIVAEELETLFNFQTLFQTFIALGEICFSLYLLSETGTDNVAAEITYLAGASIELLAYCWFGDGVTEASIDLAFAVYDSDWLSTSLSFRKQITFTLTRLTRPIYVTIGKITPLTFNTFLTIVRGAYSFFTFLKQRQDFSQ